MTGPDDEKRAGRRAELARVRAALRAASGRQRVDLLLDAKDPRAVVRALPADELWFTIRDVGLADAAPLVQLASPEQFRTFLDLEIWRGDEPDTRRALPWMRAARAGALADDDAQRRWSAKLRTLDAELVRLVLLDALRVHDLEEDPDPELASDRFMRTPENRFVVEFTVEGAEYAAVRGIVDDLYAEDAFAATRLLSALRSELRSELAETALRWRSGRLQDLGHPPLEEALSWFASPGAGPAARPGAPARPPGFLVAPAPPGSLLARAADALEPARRERLELDLVAAANAVLVADRVDVEDLEAVRGAMAAARALVELGLEERAAGGDPGPVLAATPLKALFQAGFARVLALRWRAEKLRAALAQRATGDGDAAALESPLADALAALVRRRPLYYPGLELPRDEWGGPAAGGFTARPFLSSAELARAAAALDEVEARLA
jgi:hypothetical protein